MRTSLAVAASVIILALGASSARAQDPGPKPPTISVSASGSVDYVPDIARVQLGIRAQSSTAAAAASSVNQTASQVIAAIEHQGINARSIQTTGYNLEYREPQAPQPGVMAASAGSYVASEILNVTTAVNSAGAVLDAAINAGANTSYGLVYQSSNADALYRTALARAVQAARTTADALASAAHVHIVALLALSNMEAQTGQPMAMRMMAAPAPPVMAGTDTITATVYAVYLIK